MLRNVIEIDEEKCTGCGDCVPGCAEGALQIIDGKCRLVSELFCDGLGACIGTCPEDAIKITQKEAEEYSEAAVLENMKDKPDSVLEAHLRHLHGHGAMDYFLDAVNILKGTDKEYIIKKIAHGENHSHENHAHHGGGCPGSAPQMLNLDLKKPAEDTGRQQSMLGQWPVQLHLVNPAAPYFKNSELTIMNTCGPLASANVHKDYLAGNSVVVACPKLDHTEPYAGKLADILHSGNIKKAVVVRMQVPCCGGLSQIAVAAARMSGVEGLEIEEHIMSLEGEIIQKSVLFKN